MKNQITILFPYRALFHWDSNAADRLVEDELFATLPKERQAQICKHLDSLIDLKSTVIKHYGIVKDMLKPLKLSVREKESVLNALTIPGSRGSMGYVTFLKSTQPGKSFLADPKRTKVINLPEDVVDVEKYVKTFPFVQKANYYKIIKH